MSDWRRIDIDALEPGNRLTAADLVPAAEPVSYRDVSLMAQQIKQLMARGDYSDALEYAIVNAPYGGDDQTKELHLTTVLELLKSVKQAQISQIVEELDSDQQDGLVKYLYRLMSSPLGQQNSGILLMWFDKTVSLSGIGSIVRYLNDKRSV